MKTSKDLNIEEKLDFALKVAKTMKTQAEQFQVYASIINDTIVYLMPDKKQELKIIADVMDGFITTPENDIAFIKAKISKTNQ